MDDSRTLYFARVALRNAVFAVLQPIVVENKKADRGRQVTVPTIGVDRSHEI
jgi:hypothetical protein